MGDTPGNSVSLITSCVVLPMCVCVSTLVHPHWNLSRRGILDSLEVISTKTNTSYPRHVKQLSITLSRQQTDAHSATVDTFIEDLSSLLEGQLFFNLL